MLHGAVSSSYTENCNRPLSTFPAVHVVRGTVCNCVHFTPHLYIHNVPGGPLCQSFVVL